MKRISQASFYFKIIALGILVTGLGRLNGASLKDGIAVMLKENFPDYNFIPTPFGADKRFAVKTVWVFHETFQRAGDSNRTTRGWAAFSDGGAIYPDTHVKVHRDPVTLTTINQSNSRRLSLAASILGTIQTLESSAEVKAALERQFSITVDIGNAEIEYAWYNDFLLSQEIYEANLNRVAEMLKRRFGSVPSVRVISTSLRVKDSKISIITSGEIDANLFGKVATYLSNLGFSYSKKMKSFDKLVIGDWRYIGYEAIIARKGSMAIGSGASNLPEDVVPLEWNTNAALKENIAPADQ